jgi:hypothetical protein
MLIAYAECLLEADITPQCTCSAAALNRSGGGRYGIHPAVTAGDSSGSGDGQHADDADPAGQYTPVFSSMTLKNDWQKRRFRAMRDFMRGIQEAA